MMEGNEDLRSLKAHNNFVHFKFWILKLKLPFTAASVPVRVVTTHPHLILGARPTRAIAATASGRVEVPPMDALASLNGLPNRATNN